MNAGARPLQRQTQVAVCTSKIRVDSNRNGSATFRHQQKRVASIIPRKPVYCIASTRVTISSLCQLYLDYFLCTCSADESRQHQDQRGENSMNLSRSSMPHAFPICSDTMENYLLAKVCQFESGRCCLEFGNERTRRSRV